MTSTSAGSSPAPGIGSGQTRASTDAGQSSDHGSEAHLKGHMGALSIIFIVVAAAAPLTVIGGNVALTVAGGNGVGAPAGFLIVAFVLVIFSVGYVTMTPHVKESGAYYAYIRQAFGQHSGTGAAFLAFVTYTAIEIGIYGFLGGSTAAFVESFGGPTIPWWIYAVAAWVIVAALGMASIDFSSKILGILMICEIGVVLVLDAAVVLRGGAEGITLSTFAPEHVFQSTIGVAILFALTGCIGFEATAIFRDEARDPDRTIPRATYGAVILIGVFYAISSWLLVLAWGPSNAVAQATDDPNNFMLGAMEQYVGLTARHVMDVFLITSLFACVLSLHNIATRYQFTLATERYLPRVFTKVHPKYGSPWTSSLGQSVISLVIVIIFALFDVDPLVNVFGAMAGVATTGFLLLLTATSVAVVVFFARNPGLESSTFKIRTLPSIATVLLFACLLIALANFTLVTAAPGWVSVLLALVPVVAAIGGGVLSWKLAHGERRSNDSASV